MKHNGNNSTVVPALEKALNVIEFIGRRGSPVTIKTISVDLGIPLATAYRTVKYLCNRKYLKKSPLIDGEYTLGPQLLYLAHLATKQSNLVAEAEPVMRDLTTRSGQTTQLGVLQDFGVMYIEQKLPTKPVNIVATLRTVLPVNVSASGKVLVAYLSSSEQELFLQNAHLAAQTLNSITEVSQFKQELTKVKNSGYALDHEEYARGIGCAAAPIYDHRKQVVAAIGLTGPITDYTNEIKLEQLIRWVKEAAIEISRNLGAYI